jgi:hypothetical protein
MWIKRVVGCWMLVTGLKSQAAGHRSHKRQKDDRSLCSLGRGKRNKTMDDIRTEGRRKIVPSGLGRWKKRKNMRTGTGINTDETTKKWKMREDKTPPFRVFLFDSVDKKPGLLVQLVQLVHQIPLFPPLPKGEERGILLLHPAPNRHQADQTRAEQPGCGGDGDGSDQPLIIYQITIAINPRSDP